MVNILVATYYLGSKDGEVVILTEDKDGNIVIHEFKETSGTKLGDGIRNLLQEKGF